MCERGHRPASSREPWTPGERLSSAIHAASPRPQRPIRVVPRWTCIGRWGDAEALLRVGHEVAHALQQRRGRAAGETDAAAIPSARRASLELELTYQARATVDGRSTTAPATVEAMYPPDQHARTAREAITVAASHP